MKRNLTGRGTSKAESSSTASLRRTKAKVGWSRKVAHPGERMGWEGASLAGLSMETEEEVAGRQDRCQEVAQG